MTAIASFQGLLSTSDVMTMLQVGRTTLWEMEKRGVIPKPIVLNRRCKRWRVSDIDAFLEEKAKAR